MATDDENEIDPNDPKIKALVDAAVSAATEGLSTKNKELLGEKKKIAEMLKKFEGIDPAEFAALKEKLEGLDTEDAKNKGDWTKILEARDAKAAKAQAELQEKLGGRAARAEEFAKSQLVDRELTEALSKANVVPELIKAAKGLLRESVKVADDDEKIFRAFVEIDGDEVSIAQRVKLWADSDEGKYFIAASNNGGGGSQNQGGGKQAKVNPWKKETFNLTQQMRMIQEDPVAAKRMAAEAGKTIS